MKRRALEECPTARKLSLMLLGSTPSGKPHIVKIRDELAAQFFGEGHYLEFMRGSTFAAPQIMHVNGWFEPDPDTVCVGVGSCSLSLSPWSCPFPSDVYSTEKAEAYVASRADRESWILRLNKKTLACNCRRPAAECWAALLVKTFVTAWGSVCSNMEDEAFDIDEDDLLDDCEYATDMPRQLDAAGRDELGTVTEYLSSVPASVPWPQSWVDLVRDVRALQRPSAWEIFAGSAVFTEACWNEGLNCGPPVDAADNADFNLLNPLFVAVVVGMLAAVLLDLLHLSPPCASFSAILNGAVHSRVRTREQPEGIDGLSSSQAEKVKVGNALAEVAAILFKVQHDAGNHVQLEQPARSLMALHPAVKKVLKETSAGAYQRDACVDGAPWRKPLILYTPTKRVGRKLAAECRGCYNHIRLRGRAKCGTDWTKIAAPYCLSGRQQWQRHGPPFWSPIQGEPDGKTRRQC